MLKFYKGEFDTHQLNLQIAPEPGMLPKDVSIEVITRRPESQDEPAPDTLLQVGLGNEGKAPARALWLLGNLGVANVAALASLPYRKVEPTPARLQELCIKGSLAAVRFLAERKSGVAPKVVTDSLGTPSGVWGAEENPDAYGRLDLLHPLGFQGEMSWGGFSLGMLKTGLQRNQLNRGSAYVGRRAIARAGGDVLRRKRNGRGEQLNFALGIDLIPAYKKVVANMPDATHTYLNEKDKLFPTTTVIPRLEEAGLGDYVEVIPNTSHSSPASRAGARQVAYIIGRQSPGSGPQDLSGTA